METDVYLRQFLNIYEFLPYLWGMETIPDEVLFTMFQSSYRTYEEWKQRISKLRNKVQNSFLPYLWGMETSNEDQQT